MQLIIDYREKSLMDELAKLKISYTNENLAIGDICIRSNDVDLVLLERKTLHDLASSIRDGRYKEQSFRLNDSNVHNHNIVYIIEGNLSKYNPPNMIKSPITRRALQSAIISLSYYKGFSVMRTESLTDTADYVVALLEKLTKENKQGYYEDKRKEECASEPKNYTSCIKKQKKNYITPVNIHEIMLASIPSISISIATAIMVEYKTIDNLIAACKNDSKCLEHFKHDVNGVSKKLSKPVIKNINDYLVHPISP